MCRMPVKSEYSMTEPPLHVLTQGEFRISRIFGRAWNLFTANVWKFFIITVMSELPVRAYFLWTNDRPVEGPGPLDGSITRTILMAVGFVLLLLGQAIIVHIGFQTLRRQPAEICKAVQAAVARFFSILVIFLAVWLLIFSMIALLSSLVEPMLFAMIFVIVASLLLVRWSLALPACVVEGFGPVGSLRRSVELTRAHGWKIFGIMILICAPLPAVTAMLAAAMSSLGPALQYLGRYVLGVAWITGFTSVLTVLYHDLRAAQEGLDSGQIASVFE
jgi:hypothetical protein